MKEATFNKWFNAFILIGMTLSMAILTAMKLFRAETGQAMLIAAAFGSLMGVLSTVCSANAKILTFVFGFFDVTIYGIMCLMGGNYGNGLMHILYFMPMQFVGFFQWRRRTSTGGVGKLSARRLGGRKLAACGALFIAVASCAVLALMAVAGKAGEEIVKTAIIMDAVSMTCNILGQLLMSLAYMEQWIFWIGVNIASILMWSARLRANPGSSYELIYVIKYSFYLINALNGLRIWIKLSKKTEISDNLT